MDFSLRYEGTEPHFCLPKYTPFILTQNLYELLFQYVLQPEHEKNLQAFVGRLEAYIKSKSPAPFSVPAADLAFLEEGLKELRLLNWSEIPVATFSFENLDEDNIEAALWELGSYMTVAYHPEKRQIYAYPLRTLY